jgi:PAS domain S-box-containing protein
MQIQDNLQYIVTIIVAVLASIPGIVALVASRRKTAAEAEKTEAEGTSVIAEASGAIADTATKLIGPLTERMRSLDTEVSVLRAEQRDNVIHTRELEGQILMLEQVLAKSDIKYQTLFEIIPDATLLVDANSYRIIDINPRAMDLWGYSQKEALSMCVTDLSIEPELVKTDLVNQVRRAPVRFTKSRGGTVYVTSVIMNHFTMNGKTTAVMIFHILGESELSNGTSHIATQNQISAMDKKIQTQEDKKD